MIHPQDLRSGAQLESTITPPWDAETGSHHNHTHASVGAPSTRTLSGPLRNRYASSGSSTIGTSSTGAYSMGGHSMGEASSGVNSAVPTDPPPRKGLVMHKLHPTTYPPIINQAAPALHLFSQPALYPAGALCGTYTVPNSLSINGSPIFRNKVCATTPSNALITDLHPALRTGYDYMQMVYRLYPFKNVLGYRFTAEEAYRFITYKEMATFQDWFGSGLLALIRDLGFESYSERRVDKDDFVVAVFAPNCYQWCITDAACVAYSITTACLYENLPEATVAHILRLTLSPLILVMADRLEFTLGVLQMYRLEFVRAVVVLDVKQAESLSESAKHMAASLSLKLYSMEEIVEWGAQSPVPHVPPTPELIYTLSFTSGTTGKPKGVVLTHRAYSSTIAACLCSVTVPEAITPHSLPPTALCILPLTHVYQRTVYLFELCHGATVYLPSNPRNPAGILTDLRDVKPTHLVGVPLVFNRIEAEILSKVGSLNWMVRRLAKTSMRYKTDQYLNGKVLTDHWLYDRMFHQKIKGKFGLDNTRFMITGASSMLPLTLKNLRSMLNTVFLQGYGLTESFAMIAVPFADDELDPESSGYITATAEFKLKDCPAMNFTWVENQTGALWIRGPQVAREYFKDPVATKEAFDDEGWLSTGDIAKVDAAGRLLILDRQKSFFPLALGVFISPQRVENVYLQYNPHFLTQIFVTGSSKLLHAVAVLVLDERACLDFLCSSRHPCLRKYRVVNETTMKSLNAHTLLRKEILRHLNEKIAASNLLTSTERVRNVFLFYNHEGPAGEPSPLNRGFTVENNLLTPTLKTRRHYAATFFENVCATLVAEGDLTKMKVTPRQRTQF